MWDTLFVDPIINLLLIFYKFLGHQTMLAVAILTLLFRLLLTPMMLSQQKMARKQMALQPLMNELREKYKDDPQRYMEEQQKMMRELGINPLGGCLPMFIQLPLMIALYQGIIRSLAATPLELLSLPLQIYRIPGLDLSSLIPLHSTFLWLDLALPDPYFVLPILVGATTWLSQKLMTMPSTDPQTQSTNQMMLIMMPMFLGYISLQYAAGLSVYFVISNLVSILQFYIFRKHYVTTPPATLASKTADASPSAPAPVRRRPTKSARATRR